MTQIKRRTVVQALGAATTLGPFAIHPTMSLDLGVS